MPNSPPIIGLVGGIGSGKSTVAGILAEQGCLVVDSDQLARQALEQPEIRDRLVSWWGSAILDADGRIDRSKVASIVFSSLDERKRLESLVHPWIEKQRLSLFESAPPKTLALVIDAPLLIEAGLIAQCDAVLYIDTDRETRLARLVKSRNWDEKELARREDSQLPLDDKRSIAHHIVENKGDLQSLTEIVRQVLREIINSHRP
ncbi:MAG: dephospho-CoA kinase [Planctomycetes bacterium]|nr:dephospho-CoA kinase [Planctomycetota bacterium]